MITASEKYKDYIKYEASPPIYGVDEQTVYEFENGYGASVIYGEKTYGLEAAVFYWDVYDMEMDYSTELIDGVIGHVDDLDQVLEDIKNRPIRQEEK